MSNKKTSETESWSITKPVISPEIVERISNALLSDISIFRKLRSNVDYLKINWNEPKMKRIFGETIETHEYNYFEAHMNEQLYIRSFLKFYIYVYNIYTGNGKRFHFLTKAGSERIFSIFKKKYFENFMDIIYNKYKNENVNYFSTSIYKEALEVISSTFINDKLKYFTDIKIAEIIQDWLYLDINGKYYSPADDNYIKVRTCEDLFLATCLHSSDKKQAKEDLKTLSLSWRRYISDGELEPLVQIMAKVFFIAVFNAMIDRIEYEGSELSWKIRSMEKNFYATHGCAVREHAQKSLLSFVNDAKKYKYTHDHVVLGFNYTNTNDDYSLFDCFIAPFIADADNEKRCLKLVDRYTPSQSEHRIAKLMAPYQVMYSKISTMESQVLFALNAIYNIKNLATIVDGRKNPLIKNVELEESNEFYKTMCFVKENIEEYQTLINSITKDYALLYDHSSWMCTDQTNEILKKFHEDHPKVANDPNAMLNLYNGLKTLIGSYEEYLYKYIRNPIEHIYEQFSKYPYSMDLTDPKKPWSKVLLYAFTNLTTFSDYLKDPDKTGFIDFLQNSCNIIEDDKTWSCYETVFVPIIDILTEQGKLIIKQLEKINEGFVKFEKFVCEWYMVMINRSKYITGFDINDYKKFINNSRISILQEAISELFK